MILASLGLALAAESARPVHPGDTVASLAASLGDPALAAKIRELNGLAAGEEPVVGTVVRLPDPAVVGEQRAFLLSLSGKATRQAPGGQPEPLETFVPIDNGWTVCTLEGSRATVRLASTCTNDGQASDDLVMLEQTCLVVDLSTSSKQGRSTVVRVLTGSVGVLSQEDARGHVTIVTPSGITSGPAGGFRVTIEEEAARTETLEGTATVAGSGAEVSLAPGQGSRVKTGEAPSAPVSLLVLSELLEPEAGDVLLRPQFRWSAVDGAMGYRFEIGAGADFREVLYQEDVPDPQHDPLTLMLPYNQLDGVWWRASAFDRFGFEGVPAPARLARFPPALR
ncbi:MAG: hypothetical protein KC656_03510 [Myxococcales bacterium]|nr:hypothetical protein [Myxococcales bacterium]